MTDPFAFAKAPASAQTPAVQVRAKRRRPVVAAALLIVLCLACLLCEMFIPYDPTYMDLAHVAQAPNGTFWFGTDAMGRDLFSMIFYGGRISLCIGALSTALSTCIAVVLGTLSAFAPKWLQTLWMRFVEMVMSIPAILIILFVQAFLGQGDVLSLSLTIGLTSWMQMSRVVHTEVSRIKGSAYVLSARSMGAGFWYLLRVHLLPNLVPALMFMVVSQVGAAMGTEATLSFLGIGLPLEIISWGSMLSGAERALLSGNWWMIVIPGVFLVATMCALAQIGNALRSEQNRRHHNLQIRRRKERNEEEHRCTSDANVG